MEAPRVGPAPHGPHRPVGPWDAGLTDAVAEQAERLRAFRDATSVTVVPAQDAS